MMGGIPAPPAGFVRVDNVPPPPDGFVLLNGPTPPVEQAPSKLPAPQFVQDAGAGDNDFEMASTTIGIMSADSVDDAIDAASAISRHKAPSEAIGNNQVPPPPPGFVLGDKRVAEMTPEAPMTLPPPPNGFELAPEWSGKVNLRMTDHDVAARLAAGENVAEAQPYTGFWDRAKQMWGEHTTLDQNALSILFRRTLGTQQIDPATGKPYTEDQIRALQNDRRQRREYLLAGQEPAEGFGEHAGDFAGVVAKEATAPSALLTAPIGGTQRGLARAATMAAAGGTYETVAATAEQIARDDAITDPGEIAVRGATGMVAAPVLDIALRGVGKAGSMLTDYVKATLKRRAGHKESGEYAAPEMPEPVLPARTSQTPPATPEENISQGRAAVERAIDGQSDELDAMYRPELDWVSFYWGEAGDPAKNFTGGHGIAHILAKRTAEGEDGIELVDRLVETIAKGKLGPMYGPPNGQRRNVQFGKNVAVLSLFRFGDRESWLLTGWKEVAPGAAPGVNPNRGYSRPPSGMEANAGAGTAESIAKSADEFTAPVEESLADSAHDVSGREVPSAPGARSEREDLYQQIGTDLAGDSHMGPLIEAAARTIDTRGQKGGRAVLRTLLAEDAERTAGGAEQPYRVAPEVIDQLTKDLSGEIETRLGKPLRGQPGRTPRADATESEPLREMNDHPDAREGEWGARARDIEEPSRPQERTAGAPGKGEYPDISMKDGAPFETERGAAMAKRMRTDVDLTDYQPAQVGPRHWVLRHAPAETTTARPEFAISEMGSGMLLVKGEPARIRETLSAAGVRVKGLSHKSGGLAFSRTQEGKIRAALNPRDDLELPGDIAHQWMPGERHVGMINDATLSPDDVTSAGSSAASKQKPIRREDILAPFTKALGIPLYQGRVKSKRMLGFFKPKKEEVRIKRENDLEVAAHEMAHAIDDRVPEIRKSWMTGPQAKVFREELRGVSYDKTKIYEGWAEYVRLALTQPEKAREVAPEFSKWFENFLTTHKYGHAIAQAREGMTNWYRQDAIKRAASKIGQGRNVNEALYGPLRAFRQSVSDDLDGIYRMERELTGEISPAGVYETARLTRASYSMVEGALTLGRPVIRPDGSFAFEGAGLQQILKPVTDDLDNWTLYAVGRSAMELQLQGREKLFTLTEIRAMRALETPAFKTAFEKYQEWNRAVVDFAEGLGLINPETRKLWKRTQYLPFHRVSQGSAGGGQAGGAEGTWSGIKRLTGGTGNIRDVLGNMIQNAGGLMTAALRNDARVQVANMADQVRGGGRFMAKIPKISKAVKVSREEVIRVMKDAGITDDMVATLNKLGGSAEEDFSQLADFVTMFQHAQAPAGKNIVAVYRGGKPDYYEVIDPILMRAVSSLERPAKNWLVRFLNGFRRIGQASITLTADFMMANIARDTLMGAIFSRHGFKPFVDSIRGMKSRVTKDPLYREFIANGGGFSSHLVDEQAFKKHLQRFYTKQGIDARFVIDAPGKVLYFLETLVDAFEMSTRLGEFKQARAGGAHPRHAAYSAREVSTDFGMRGDSEVLGFFYDTVMFLKAGVNGLDRGYRGFVHDPNKWHIAAKTGVLAAMSMALYAYNRRFAEYRDMEDWKKDSYWHFFIPKEDGTHHHFMYPKIWEIGAVASGAERSLEHMLDGDLKEYAIDFSRIVMNQFKFDYMPQALAPVYEQFLNRNRFTDRPIETQDMEQLAPFARSKPYTAEVLKDLGFATRDMPRQLQIPPARAEALLRGYFNTWALYGLTLSDAMLHDDKPDLRVDQYPVLRRFYSADPEQHSKYESIYYDLLKEATELRRTMRHMDKINRPNIADELERRPETARYNQLNHANEELQGIRQEMYQVQIDPTLTSAEKRRQMDALTREKDDLLKLVVENVESQEATSVR